MQTLSGLHRNSLPHSAPFLTQVLLLRIRRKEDIFPFNFDSLFPASYHVSWSRTNWESSAVGHHLLPVSFMCMNSNATHSSQFNFLFPQQIKAIFLFCCNSLINRLLDISIYFVSISHAITTSSDYNPRKSQDCREKIKWEVTGWPRSAQIARHQGN